MRGIQYTVFQNLFSRFCFNLCMLSNHACKASFRALFFALIFLVIFIFAPTCTRVDRVTTDNKKISNCNDNSANRKSGARHLCGVCQSEVLCN